MPARDGRDRFAIGLLCMGLGLAVVATFLPLIRLGEGTIWPVLPRWEMLPVFARLKFLALALMLAASLIPQLRKWRILAAALAVVLVFVPAISAFLGELYAWGMLHDDHLRFQIRPVLLVSPGMANLLLVVAALAVNAALWRIEMAHHPDARREAMARA
ncbi:hypothetical protein [Sediminicoccus sp. KRV36]|uniref:hypothetical protein n=1 Tax=Sediminicoccus sp. KRV36 TaxID=3133721 RepID=UPI00200D3A4E|nr:hypothetical protein [Sediminicoccus rosea]UPY34964.1 hypothetical protein LHU95_12035 [Sediminicoccus rosea]